MEQIFSIGTHVLAIWKGWDLAKRVLQKFRTPAAIEFSVGLPQSSLPETPYFDLVAGRVLFRRRWGVDAGARVRGRVRLTFRQEKTGTTYGEFPAHWVANGWPSSGKELNHPADCDLAPSQQADFYIAARRMGPEGTTLVFSLEFPHTVFGRMQYYDPKDRSSSLWIGMVGVGSTPPGPVTLPEGTYDVTARLCSNLTERVGRFRLEVPREYASGLLMLEAVRPPRPTLWQRLMSSGSWAELLSGGG